MADTATRPAPVGRLQRSQEARRARVLATVLDLAIESGYDAIQLRPISERTGISTDTIYRYFGSRDDLVSAAVAQWLDHEYIGPAATWGEGDTPAEQLLAFYRQVWTIWERNPKMLETFTRAALAEGDREDGLAARTVQGLVPLTAEILRDVEPSYRTDLLMVIEHFAHSAMTFVVRGVLPIEDVFPQLERTVRRLAQHPAMVGHRPDSWEWDPSTTAN